VLVLKVVFQLFYFDPFFMRFCHYPTCNQMINSISSISIICSIN
jgi:hypothetical protein